MAFVAGFTPGSPTWTATGAGGPTTIPVVSHAWKDKIDALDVTSTNHAGLQALIAGILRGDGQITLCFNTSQVLWGTITVVPGASGIMTFPVGLTQPFSVPCMIIDVGQTTKVEDKVMIDVTIRFNTIAGTYTRAS